jgi:hypothetical protein
MLVLFVAKKNLATLVTKAVFIMVPSALRLSESYQVSRTLSHTNSKLDSLSGASNCNSHMYIYRLSLPR